MLDFFTNQHCFFLRMVVAAPIFASWLYHCAGDNLWYVLYGFSTRHGKCRAIMYSFSRYILLGMIPKVILKMIHRDWTMHPLFWLITETCASTIKHSVFSVMVRLIVEMLFMPVSNYNAVEWFENQWIWSVQVYRLADFLLINN